MIQRKQSLYLLAAFIFTMLCLCMQIGSFFTEGMRTLSVYNLYTVNENGAHSFTVWPLFAALLLEAVVTLVVIFMYNNRVVQARFCLFNILLIVGWYVCFFVMTRVLGSDVASFRVGIPAAFPAVSLILLVLARRAILADEWLVRSMDRIR